MWAFDPWDAVAAEVAAALHVGHRRASGQMRIAVALRDRLPTVAALHLKGALSPRIVSAITWCTHLVEDEQALALIDAAVADRATRWGPLSEDKLRQAIEVWVGRYDPAALRRTQAITRGRDLSIGACDDDTDTTALWGRLLATDAAVLQQRVTAMANGVCQGDPRSIGERRADALGALANGNQHLACACGSPACPVAGQPPKSHVVIRVIAEQAAVEAATKKSPGSTNPPPSPALLLGHGVLPAPLLAEAIRTGATDQADPDARRRARAAAIGRHPSWPSSSGCAICSAASPAATCPPNCVISTMPGPGRGAPPTPQTSAASADTIT